MRILIILSLFTLGQLAAQPIANIAPTEQRGHYIFTVVNPATNQETSIWTFGSYELTTHRLSDAADTSTIHFRPLPHAYLRTFFTSAPHASSQAGAAAAGATEVIEAVDDQTIAEVLHYPALLSPEQRQLTESYLALKHGLTLNQARPTNYLRPVAGGSQPVWTATTANEYRHRIIGLAFDPASSLNRRVGHSVLAPKELQLSWTNQPDTTAYLVMADNGGPTARLPNRRQLQRRWRVETTGAIPPTTLSWDTRKFFDRAQPGELWSLTVDLANGDAETYQTTATTDAQLFFTDLHFPANGEALVSLSAASAALEQNDAFFHSVTLSPNPVRAGQKVQLRAASNSSTALTMSIYDMTGRQIESRSLPTSTHHLTEVSFPAPGTYTLHLRPRLYDRKVPQTHVKVVVQ